MKKFSLLTDYLAKYAASPHWKLCAKSIEDIKQVIIIPAYAELEMLFDTLASIAANPEPYLDNTLVICVINNKADASETVRNNNSQTLQLLSSFIENRHDNYKNNDSVKIDSVQKIAASRIRLGYIDASSPNLEIPQKAGGVGMSRKIGMDTALRIFQYSDVYPKLIMSLDADTLVRDDYLPIVIQAFNQSKISTGLVDYEHQVPSDSNERLAICAYEIFLRYWIWGLRYAGSPYAFHSIGSTIVTTSEAYLSVRGMNRREAGEDFYFLNKLAKVGPLNIIEETKVYPSARISARVPFGTGVAIEKITASCNREYNLYDPQVFEILRKWLICLNEGFPCTVEKVLAEAKNIHEGLAKFLMERKFISVWPKIHGNVKTFATYGRHVNNWFDGFETLKLINYLTREYYPKIGMYSAIQHMMNLQNGQDQNQFIPEPGNQMEILSFMRRQRWSEDPCLRSKRG